MPEFTTAPGPSGLPILGSVFPAWRDPLRLFLESQATYGDVVRFKFGPYDYYLINDPEVVRHVLVDNAKAYTKSRNYLGLKMVLGDGLLTSEGEAWRQQRRLAQPGFHRDKLAGFAKQMATATRAMLERWNEEGDGAFDVHEDMMRLTFRIVGLTLFSSDVDGDAKDVGEAVEVAMHWANDYAESILRIPPFVPTPANVRFKRAMKTLDDVVFRLIADHRATPKPDLLGMLIDARDEATNQGMTDRQLRDEVITMVLAGHETTANLLSWAFVLLSRHPEIARRVQAEAQRVLGDRDATLDDVKQLDLTRRVLDETLRLYPPAWAFERQSLTPDVLGAYRIEKGSIVGICPYALHRHPAYWENPEGFDPDRFLPDAAERPKWAYLPFGGGPRTCIGNHFALMEAQLVLAMIVRDYAIALDPFAPPVLDPVITLRPKHGVRASRTRRAAATTATSGCPARRTPIESPVAPS
jgi:cytochrome P450